MPRKRPPTSGYARIAQAEEESGTGYLDDSDEEALYQTSSSLPASAPRYAPIQPHPHGPMQASGQELSGEHWRSGAPLRRVRSNSGVDIKAINARLERWAEEIASKFKIGTVKGKKPQDEQLEIHHSVFRPPEGLRPATSESLTSEFTESQGDRLTKMKFDDIVESVRVAIELGVHPKMISQGSSGSYFARDSEGNVVGVFKPKDEEPYASRNPKWTKWIHRNLFPCFFGRACLIPNLSYVSEAAAYVLDSRLRTNLVPYTDIVYLSSKSFFYDFWDRSNHYRKRKPLPQKVGSLQVFLKGFKDANLFLKEHPWPDQQNSSFRTSEAPKRVQRPWNETCRPSGAASDDEEQESDGATFLAPDEENQQRKFFWTEALQQSFREELEKLVILDYIMRNTDRGLDNWMIKVDWYNQEVSIVSEPPKQTNGDVGESSSPPQPAQKSTDGVAMSELYPYRRQDPMAAISRSATPSSNFQGPSISIGAIDNSLSWPWKHPDAWRSFPFGWLFLPVSLIGQPFSQKSRDHFLPLLTSTTWWSDTQFALRRIFSQDSDFKESMFARQIAVMKGQAWNVVETLKTRDHGPLELTRRTRVCVWDDIVDIPVAVPLRPPSAEMRRRREADMNQTIEEEEMDISAANASAPIPQHDLLGLSSPAVELPNPNRFSLSRNSSGDIRPSEEVGKEPTSPVTVDGVSVDRTNSIGEIKGHARPNHPKSRARVSYEEPRRAQGTPGTRRRRYSFSTRRGSTALLYADDDLEGDLGYAAAEGMEGNQRKVIVERLETVKSKNPVFSWC
ncbi:MAG: phosphatidyl inositol kinase [Pycnora praestabilis]|nr:MAG: phosphatidyl inositol kinase [Pycnora praestabilis]